MMRKKLFYTLLFLLVAGYQTVLAQDPIPTSGDDKSTGAYGYAWVTSEDTDKPATYNWIDISADGTVLNGISDDNFVGPVPIGFKFKYYWLDYEELFVGTNGYVMFGRGMNIASDAGGFPIYPTDGPATTPSNFVGILLSDLTFTDSSHVNVQNAKCYYKTLEIDGSKKFVLTYENVPFWTNDNPEHYSGSNTFQIILDEATKTITLNYKNCKGPVASAYTQPGENYITIGMENITGRLGLNIAKNVLSPNPNDIFELKDLAIEIWPPKDVSFEFNDVMVEWILNKENGGVFRSAGGDAYPVQASIKNSGTKKIEPPAVIQVTQRIIDYFDGGSVMKELSDTIPITSLMPGESKVVAFNKPFAAPKGAVGSFRVMVQAKLVGGDDYSLNDNIEAEIVAVDTTENIIELGYNRFAFRDEYPNFVDPPANDEVGIGLEVGMSFESPFYPAYIHELIFDYIIGNNGDRPDTLVGFITNVYDDSGPFGTPGSEPILTKVVTGDLYAEDYLPEPDGVTPSQIKVHVPVQPPIKLEKGKVVYVSYAPRIPSTLDSSRRRLDFVTVENAVGVPTSFRSYEITGGIWAPYRSRSTTDFSIFLGISPNPSSVEKNLAAALFEMGNIYPNPTQEGAKLPYTLKQPAQVSLVITNLLGQVVLTQDMGKKSPGTHTLDIDTAEFNSGIYTCTLTVNEFSISSKLVVTK